MASKSPKASLTPTEKSEHKSKVDPSFKSKRYRDKLRTEVKTLEALLPVDRTALSRKLDSQTVFRLVIALLRTKAYFQAVGQTAESSESQGLFPPPLGLFTGIEGHDPASEDSPSPPLHGLSYLQILDGFLLVLTADGTILYISDNVLQYLGYNQVDLMHRCLYSIIHQDDMMELKMVLETSLGHFMTQFTQQGSQAGANPLEECGIGGIDTCRPLSFICRMRCFSGSSVGYLKMHCSGKIVHISRLPKGKRCSNNVVLLFCNPFMLRAQEFTIDLQKNIFWTKHDLDLNIKELDKKGSEIIGYSSEELEKQSFYSMIHPEDLTALATCHKLLVESSDVQTVYFRMQSRGGDWVWLTSRGKVISKNSKKFSIAFSHCPIREEDSTYIQQEAALRQRYAIGDLMCLVQLKHASPQALNHVANREEKSPRAKKSDHRYQPYTMNGNTKSAGKSEKKEESVLDTSCVVEVACPSAWHALSDRHSPVLPSSHVAHKISQKEKQLQFQEFCKRQQLGSNVIKQQKNWHSPQEENSSVLQQEPSTQRPSLPVLGNQANSNGFFYPLEATRFAGTGYGTPYSLSGIQGYGASPAGYFHHWYHHSGLTTCDAEQHNLSATCLTPTRSPHLPGGSITSAESFHQMQGNVPAEQYSGLQPPPLSSLTAASMAGHCAEIPVHALMPPSPPPSPHPAVFFQRLAPSQSYRHTGVSQACDSIHSSVDQLAYLPGWCQAPQQTSFKETAMQPPPYPSTCSQDFAPFLSKSAKNDQEKALLTHCADKRRKSVCDLRDTDSKVGHISQVNREHDLQIEEFKISKMGTPELGHTWNGQATGMGKPPSEFHNHFGSADMHSNFNSMGSAMTTNMVKHPTPCPPQGHWEGQVIHSSGFVAPSGPVPVPQYMHYCYQSSQPDLRSPPVYQYGAHSQYGYQGEQYPANSFYLQHGGQIKSTTEYPRTIVEHSLDMPSIGSFLEYLNEV